MKVSSKGRIAITSAVPSYIYKMADEGLPTFTRGLEVEELNKEVLRLVSSMPNWEPAVSRGKKICMEYTLPFNFSLKSRKELKKLDRERRR